MRSRLTPLFKLLYNPLQAMADLAARSPYLTGLLLALAASIFYHDMLSDQVWVSLSAIRNRSSATGQPSPLVIFALELVGRIIGNAAPVIFMTVVFVPACLLAASLVDRRASFSVLLRQEYGALASCVLYSWATAQLVMLPAAWALFKSSGADAEAIEAALDLVPLPYFIFLVTLALHVVLRLTYRRAVGVVALGAFSLLALPLVPNLLFLLTSPFLLLLVIIILRNVLGDMMSAQRAREAFKQNLEAATLNPADASAHYNLGLIYQQRGQFDEAKPCFRRAIEIDPEETDAYYQLGRIAREQGELAEAIAHFDAVVSRDAEHSQNEIWREVGRAYLQAGQHEDARAAFESFLRKRPSDAEGLYRYGMTLHRLGHAEEAATQMQACIEAVRTAPAYKYRTEKRWMSEAESFLRSQTSSGQ